MGHVLRAVACVTQIDQFPPVVGPHIYHSMLIPDFTAFRDPLILVE